MEQCQNIIVDWLSDYDLELKPEKTHIGHTLKTHNGNKPGFNFLGFNIRQYPVGKYQSGKLHGETLGFKTLIKPSDESIKRHYAKLSEIIRRYNAAPQEALIAKLNPIIRGWCNYYRTVCSKQTYTKISHLVTKRLLHWGYRRHKQKPRYWIVNKYWGTVEGDNWAFMDKRGISLLKHPKIAIKRHIKVRGESSPYDGNKTYWATRKGNHPEVKDSIARLLKKQKGKCRWCGLTFHDGDKIEKDHITPRALGGNYKDNLQLLHKHCHDIKTKEDLKSIKKHEAIREYQKFVAKFNYQNWEWIDDIPTLVGILRTSEERSRVR